MSSQTLLVPLARGKGGHWALPIGARFGKEDVIRKEDLGPLSELRAKIWIGEVLEERRIFLERAHGLEFAYVWVGDVG
jgi:hypothetical protein